MALITLRQLLDHAAEYGYGVPAFNVNNMEQIQAIMQAADAVDAPVIIQASRGARQYAGDVFLRRLMQAATEMWPHIPVVMHQDHGNNPQTCLSAIANNFTSVMMDGSLHEDGKTPADYDYNATVTRRVCNMAHLIGVSVEGELGCLGSLETGKGDKEDGHGFDGELSREQLLTDPDEAERFVKATQVDALAVAIGTSHGAYKFSRKPDGNILALDVVRRIHEKLPTLHMVMHGSSSVPQELQDIINENGGTMPQTFGVPVEEIVEGIKYGVRKVNIDTDCRMAIIGQYRKISREQPQEFDPRKFNKPAIAKMRELCQSRLEAFGAAGQAVKIKPASLDTIAEKYATGTLMH
ncbi:fructose-bisphosphate aldolase class II [Candidatus Persebacteraceae bacterium Df01]|jgi:fructose-bisphosphate aldolase class II|uniref:Fructose-1,6-bisphosphate aldolase n=1 Tax=Candidatus Doriopsillibacter californiensis TaxID=2970740 RepID=A0ABT7QK42_9GAMM|nr:fructose-bisphosphate aldolase class II [Candidatus Persebacteraceae bacterium Df01]